MKKIEMAKNGNTMILAQGSNGYGFSLDGGHSFTRVEGAAALNTLYSKLLKQGYSVVTPQVTEPKEEKPKTRSEAIEARYGDKERRKEFIRIRNSLVRKYLQTGEASDNREARVMANKEANSILEMTWPLN